ncbi:MAG TPA: trimethylamine methyltransferase family protein, partial [Candidatus Cybelea sp.]|nr:trimethylamine methyltransferase family protein [Candidatus Cybelea sp.]
MENTRPTRRPRRMRENRAIGLSMLGQPPLRNVMKPLEILSQDQLMAIHEASLDLLENIGIEFMGATARQKFREAGATVDDATGLVKIPREVVAAALKTAPSIFVLTPRNPARQIHAGEDYVSFGLVAGPPNVHDCVNGRRSGNLQDYIRLIQLAHSFDVIHFVGNQPTAPIELPAHNRHLDCYLANITYSDRVYHCSAIGRDRALDGIDMMAISKGKTRE